MPERYELIEWIDHSGSGDLSWWTIGEIKDLADREWLITTSGENIYENETTVVLGLESQVKRDGVVVYREFTVILKALIVRRVALEAVAEKKDAGPADTTFDLEKALWQ